MDPNIISQLPPEFLKNLPIATPPTRIKSNFINPESNGFVLTTVTSIFLGFQILIFAARIYTRAFIARKLRWDDCKSCNRALKVVFDALLLILSSL